MGRRPAVGDAAEVGAGELDQAPNSSLSRDGTDRGGEDGRAALARATNGHRHLVAGSSWMIVAVVGGAISGFVFWFLATRRYSDAEVGRATSVFNVVMLVNFLTSLGLPVAIARFGAPGSSRELPLFRWALGLTTLGSAVGALLFAVAVPDDVLAPLSSLRAPFGPLLLFVLVNGMSFAALCDMWLLAQRRAYLSCVRIAAVGLLRLPLLLVDADGGPALWLVLVAAGTPATAGYVWAWWLARRRVGDSGAAAGVGESSAPPAAARPWGARGPDGVLRYSLVNHLSLLGVQAPQFAMPLLVSSRVDDATNANFYIAWTITMIAFSAPLIIGQALVAEGGRAAELAGVGAAATAPGTSGLRGEQKTAELAGVGVPATAPGTSGLRGNQETIDRQCLVALILGIALMAPLAVLAKIGAPWVLEFYGESYRRAAGLLPRLLLAGVPWAAVAVFVARARVLGRTRELLTVTLVFPLVVLTAASLWMDRAGLRGVANGWILGNIVVAVVAILTYLLTRSGLETRSGGREPNALVATGPTRSSANPSDRPLAD